MDWVCYRTLFPDRYSFFLDEDLSEPRRDIPSVARTAGRGCCFATAVFFSMSSQHQEQGLASPVMGTHNPTPSHVCNSLPIHSQPLTTCESQVSP